LVPESGQSPFGQMFGLLGTEEFAMFKFFTESPMFASFSGMMPKFDKFKVGERETIEITFLLVDDVTQRHTLFDDKIKPNAELTNSKDLPSSFLAEVDERLKVYKELLGPLMELGVMGGEGIVPPW
ncbi:MAG: hypothetical protein JNM34_12025, partial [Chthonomonadaceae bacterium]|nr:hypothetical protein [Chthonomonadaceae bacterium]